MINQFFLSKKEVCVNSIVSSAYELVRMLYNNVEEVLKCAVAGKFVKKRGSKASNSGGLSLGISPGQA